MRKAVTLVELVFVIVLLAVLSATALMVLPKNRAISDAKYLSSLVTQTRFKAQGNQEKKTCIFDLNETNPYIEGENNNSDYELAEPPSVSSNGNTLCFDWMGKVYKSKTDDDPLSVVTDINVTAQGKDVTVLIFPVTGYVKIKR